MSDAHRLPQQVHHQSGQIRRRHRADGIAGLVIAGLCVGLGALVILMGASPRIPLWTWSLLFLLVISAGIGGVAFARRHLQLTSYALAVAGSWGMVVSVPEHQMIMVLLVVLAAAGVYILPLPWVMGVVVLNCCVVLLTFLTADSGPRLTIAVSAAVFHAIIHLASVLSAYALSRESRLRAELEAKNVELLAAGLLLEDSTRSSERLRISRELHDLMGHQLTVLSLELEAAKHRDGAAARAHLDRAHTTAGDLLADVRRTVGELRDAEPESLRAAVETISAAVPSLTISLCIDDGLPLDEEQTGALIRAAQEVITNTIRHSEAGTLTLEITARDGDVHLVGTDDGTVGDFRPGHGLEGLRERAEALGGRLSVTPAPQFTVHMTLPLRGVGRPRKHTHDQA